MRRSRLSDAATGHTASTTNRREHPMNTTAPASRANLLEPLERRTLLSAAWSTVDRNPNGLYLWNMTADKAGNVYLVGSGFDGGETLEKKASGSSDWTTIL